MILHKLFFGLFKPLSDRLSGEPTNSLCFNSYHFAAIPKVQVRLACLDGHAAKTKH